MGYLIAISVYLLALVIYGLVIAHKKVKTADDMVTGGHRIPFIILVGSLLATWCGGGGITGSAGVVRAGRSSSTSAMRWALARDRVSSRNTLEIIIKEFITWST